ncbi:MAG: hypothetical protein ACK5NN_04835 [Sphingomonadaceae bacterium]
MENKPRNYSIVLTVILALQLAFALFIAFLVLTFRSSMSSEAISIGELMTGLAPVIVVIFASGASVLLWREQKQTLACICALTPLPLCVVFAVLLGIV